MDHKGLEKVMDKLAEMMREIEEGGSVAQLLAQMEVYEELSLPHFKQEEVECLPLMRAYFTPHEISVTVQKVIKNGPKVEGGSFIATMVRFALGSFASSVFARSNDLPIACLVISH
jgi:hemerythrin-like domain-containing protein